MTREQWRAYWRWLRLEKKRLAWECGPVYPDAPIVIDWGKVGCLAPIGGLVKFGSFSTADE